MFFFPLITGRFRKAPPAQGIFVETHRYEKGFAQYYKNKLKPRIRKFEEQRIKALELASFRARITLLIYSTIILMAAPIMRYFGVQDYQILPSFLFGLLTLVLMFLVHIYTWIHNSINEYRYSVKAKIFPTILSFFGKFSYKPNEGNDLLCQEVQISGLIPNYYNRFSEDLARGEYNGVMLNLFVIYKSKEDRIAKDPYNSLGSYDTEFKGMVIQINMHKKFSKKTIIKKNYPSLIELGRKIIFFNSRKRPAGLADIKLEDRKFNKMFSVYSNNQIEARYLITTSFMERLINLAETLNGKTINCSFYNNKLLIMIPMRKPLFTTGSIYKSEDFIDDSKNVLKAMNIICAIIDELKLHQDIGM